MLRARCITKRPTKKFQPTHASLKTAKFSLARAHTRGGGGGGRLPTVLTTPPSYLSKLGGGRGRSWGGGPAGGRGGGGVLAGDGGGGLAGGQGGVQPKGEGGGGRVRVKVHRAGGTSLGFITLFSV